MDAAAACLRFLVQPYSGVPRRMLLSPLLVLMLLLVLRFLALPYSGEPTTDAASPPGSDFGEEVPGVRQRWKQVLHLANVFWARWIRSYLPTLRARAKWQTPQRNVSVGDVVLIVDKLLDRPYWPLARVTQTFAGPDGLVRSVEVRTAAGLYRRPIHRLCLLEESA